MKKCLIAFLLVLTLLPISSLAGAYPGAGSQGTPAASGAGNDIACAYHTGLALGIQRMDGTEYTVTPENKSDWIANAEINNKGLAHVCEHFLRSYPNPYTKPGAAGVVYFLPKTTYEPKYMIDTSSLGYINRAGIAGHYYRSGDYTAAFSDTLANDIYSKIKEGTISGSYFDGIMERIDPKTALSLIGHIFGPTVKNGNNWAPNVSAINNNWKVAYEWNPDRLDVLSEDYTRRKLANYAAILLSLARILPEENWEAYVQYVEEFVLNASEGKAYQPVVITAEVCQVFRHENSKLHYDTWRTVPEHLALCAGVPESQIRNADGAVLSVTGLGDGDTNMAQTILKAAIAKNTNGGKIPKGSAYGGVGMLGMKADGSLSGSAHYSRVMTSLSDSVVKFLRSDSIPTDWNISVPGNGSTEALWGCGIFGGTEALTVIFVLTRD